MDIEYVKITSVQDSLILDLRIRDNHQRKRDRNEVSETDNSFLKY
jgi:hypothetical protein